MTEPADPVDPAGAPVADDGPPRYHEWARTYRSMWYLGGILIALFCVDIALGSAVEHLPGWIIGAVLVLGVDAFIVHSARVTKSLTLTDAELRVGDEAVGRAEIIGMRSGPDSHLPVLGWPNGMPRGTSGIVVRLFDDQDVTVPCRHPDQLLRALAGVPYTDGPAVREAESDDLAELAEIAERADTLFRTAGYDLPHIALDADGAASALVVFVAGRPAVAFAQVDEVDGVAHLAEIGAIPKVMRQGVGSRLLEQACSWARDAGYDAITLITYADVPWNAPWYAKHGFVEIEPSTPELTRRRRRQTDLGLDEVGRRIVMRRELP